MPQGADGATPAGRVIPPANGKAGSPKAVEPKETAVPASVEPAQKPTEIAAEAPVSTAPDTSAEKPKSPKRTKASEVATDVAVSAPVDPAEGSAASETPAPDAPVETPAAAPEELPPRKIDSNVLAVLREEAEREASRRAAEAAAVEAQAIQQDVKPAEPIAPEALTEEEAKPAPSSAVAKLQAAIAKPIEAESKPKGDTAATDAAIAAVLAATLGDENQGANRQGKGRELLPDIEEIKSSLRSTTDDGAGETDDPSDDPVSAAKKRHGFRQGFTTALTLGILASAVYVAAPRVVAVVPALAGPMESYVSTIDSARVWVDTLLRSATSSLEGES